MHTQLKNRQLWFDGDITVKSVDDILTMIERGVSTDKLFVEELNKDITQYNQYVSKHERITIKDTCADLSFKWNIPPEYDKLDVKTFIERKLLDQLESIDDDELVKKYVARTRLELNLYEKLNLNKVLQAVIYIINILYESGEVWGVGRGSSVSSYVLYLIGVHDVDSVKYDLNITDFLS